MAAVLGGPDGRENLILWERATDFAADYCLPLFVVHFNGQHAGRIPNRIGEAKTKFAWWLLGKWLGFTAAGFAIAFPWIVFIVRALRKLRSSSEGCTLNQPRTTRRSPNQPTKSRRVQRKSRTKRRKLRSILTYVTT